MKSNRDTLLHEVASYYGDRLTRHGATPQGVDWNGEKGQVDRFAQLARVIDRVDGFTLNDLGCGYGALVDFLTARYGSYQYYGYDVSAEMIAAARERYQDRQFVTFRSGSIPEETANYGVASGIFNVRLGITNEEWFEYLLGVLDVLDRTSLDGFAFNCLTSYSDPERMRSDLFYADPCQLFDHCKRRYSKNVALLHDYGLYEFTIVVRKASVNQVL
jgi:SAM-dependent methyltransferase